MAGGAGRPLTRVKVTRYQHGRRSMTIFPMNLFIYSSLYYSLSSGSGFCIYNLFDKKKTHIHELSMMIIELVMKVMIRSTRFATTYDFIHLFIFVIAFYCFSWSWPCA